MYYIVIGSCKSYVSKLSKVLNKTHIHKEQQMCKNVWMTSIPILWKTVCRCRFLDKLHCVIIIVCYQICLYHPSDTGLSSSPTEQTTNTTLCFPSLLTFQIFCVHFFLASLSFILLLTFSFCLLLSLSKSVCAFYHPSSFLSLSPSRSVPSALLDLGYFPFVFISLSCSLWIRQWILTQTHGVCSAKSVGITTLNQARARGRRRKKSRYPPGFVQIQLMQNKELIWTWERPNVGLSGPYPHLTKMNGTIPTE